jgi:hypothetical protein
MSEFVFVIPEGWTQISEEVISQIGSPIGDWINIGDMLSLTEALRTYNAFPADIVVTEARFFNGEVLVVR